MATSKTSKGETLSQAERKEQMAVFAKAIYAVDRATSRDEENEQFGKAFVAFLELHQQPVEKELLILVTELAVEAASYAGRMAYFNFELERGIELGIFKRDSEGYISRV